MINEQIIGYIQHQLSQNVSREVITANLKGTGWADADVAEAFKAISPVAESTPTPAPVSTPATSYSTQQPISPDSKSKKIFSIVGVLVLLGLVGGYVFYMQQKKELSTKSQTENQETNQPLTQTSTTSNPEIERVEVILGEIRQGYLTGNPTLVVKHASMETASFFSSTKMDISSAFTVNNVVEVSGNIVANLTIVSGGKSETQDMVFIKEGDNWKFDLKATFQYGMDQEEKKKQSIVDDKNGYVDLVTDIKVIPTNPKISDGNTKIVFSVTNKGTKAVQGQEMKEEIFSGPSKKYLISAGSYPITIAPGEVWEHSFYWSDLKCDKFSAFCFKDKGNVEFYYSINLDKQVQETNYTNNEIVKNIYFEE